MKYIEIIASERSAATVSELAAMLKAEDLRFGLVGDDGMQSMRLLINDAQLQSALDKLQMIVGAQPTARILVLPVEAALPQPDKEKPDHAEPSKSARESLYQEVDKGACLDCNYFLLVILSTVVATIGLIENNVAVIIGAMVIAPLLGPNLALSLGTALGDSHLMRMAAKTLLVGVFLSILLAAIAGMFWPQPLDSSEIMLRTQVGLDSVLLALASGTAAALSLTTGLPSVLVGVMVAVALLPPAATFGLLMGAGQPDLAWGAALLLGVNIVSVNLSSKLVFLFRGISPRTWFEKERARKAMVLYLFGWIISLGLLIFAIYMRGVIFI
ncbi:TIGR00341 family protein [Neptuniibacter sp. CAU 1671]|uniref:TIGR00341 family protein n=1 Tax=Neptuniibacter sp. CAU 1671 TaxID=3032593 RepID=UPI0023DCB50E|nr:TIGR00341 family protein [Neptuniibacter sp. CAU 1671]MDF2180675.1 TIGR00341 family protein [Neptuniibacter sp. CAU 1671]